MIYTVLNNWNFSYIFSQSISSYIIIESPLYPEMLSTFVNHLRRKIYICSRLYNRKKLKMFLNRIYKSISLLSILSIVLLSIVSVTCVIYTILIFKSYKLRIKTIYLHKILYLLTSQLYDFKTCVSALISSIDIQRYWTIGNCILYKTTVGK